ncbi:Double-stranded RNA-binding protein 3 [Raphanus sativus]|uniref:Double-stranded RNA-binding protein 3-like n=1 Tax=Raphanus sativus TaxID=3726 RepID=A0A9W3BZ56_RAPSA|nr:double-stranded RNA-binding protein 3-like [Raphanus sativus]KAJ4888286.1 Double-stranded RNA-binding protein 3 [Raphanus sativus]
MYKNQLQELAQRSCFSLPSYTCTREGPDHAPRFKASVNFNGEIFESPTYCSTLRQAEHSAAEVALSALSSKGPSKSLTARVLDETGIYKNLLQETAHRAGLDLPVYTSVRSGPGHIPTFSCTVELAGLRFSGESAKTKKQAEKNAAISAWFSLRKMPTSLDSQRGEEKEREVVARVLSRFRPKEVRRREQHHSRRRAIRQDTTTTRDFLCEKLRLISPYTEEASSSSSSAKHNQTLPPRFWSSTTDLQQQQECKVKSLLEKSKEHAGLKQRSPDDDAKPEMIVKSFPLSFNPPSSSSMERRSCYSKLLPFPEMFAGGLGLNHQKLAPAVHMRSVIPVCSAPPPKPPSMQFNEPNTSSCSAPSSLGIKGQEKKSLRWEMIESKISSNP